MNGVKKFTKAMLVIILVVIIVGGGGYIGYSLLTGHNSGHSTVASNEAAKPQNNTGDPPSTNEHPSMNQTTASNSDSNAIDTQQGANGQQTPNQVVAMNQSGAILNNKEELERAISKLNDSLKYLTLDPYAPAEDGSANNENIQQQSVQGIDQTAEAPAVNVQGNNSINVYPNNSTVFIAPPSSSSDTASSQPAAAVQPDITIKDMGIQYDPAKMEQLHAGLLKMAMGMQVLNQLNEQLISQAGYANVNIIDPVQYYLDQYNFAIENRTRLSQAKNYITEASTLVNINPYVSADGLVYDKDRMSMLHQGVYKLAEGMATLEVLYDSITKQSVNYANTAQSYINQVSMTTSAVAQDHSAMQAAVPNHTSLTRNALDVQSIVNILLIVFVVSLILGILGFILSLVKSRSKEQKPEYKPEDAV